MQSISIRTSYWLKYQLRNSDVYNVFYSITLHNEYLLAIMRSGTALDSFSSLLAFTLELWYFCMSGGVFFSPTELNVSDV